jgi:hypothetical protein
MAPPDLIATITASPSSKSAFLVYGLFLPKNLRISPPKKFRNPSSPAHFFIYSFSYSFSNISGLQGEISPSLLFII